MLRTLAGAEEFRFRMSSPAVWAGLTLLAAMVALLPLPWIIVGLGGVAGVLCLLRWPWLVWLAPAAALPVASGLRLGQLTLTEILLGAAMFWWLIAGSAQRSLRTAPHPLMAPLAIYVLVIWLSSLGAADLGEAIKEMVKWVEFGAVLLLAPAMLYTRNVRWLVAALLAAAIAQALVGLYQFIFRIGPEWFTLFDRFMRASGSFRQPNPFAGYLGLTLPVAFGLALWGFQATFRRRQALVWALFYAGATLVILTGLLVSWSRGGWLGAAVGLVVVLLVYNRRAAKGAALLVGLGVLALLVAALAGAINPAWAPAVITARVQGGASFAGAGNFGFGLLDQPVTDENFAVLERLAHWLAALRMFSAAPWLGVGPGNYSLTYPAVRLPLWVEPLGHAHNIYLNVLAETGLIGLGAFLLLWGSAVVWVWRRASYNAVAGARELDGDAGWRAALAAGVLGTLAYLAVHSMFDNLFVQGIYLQLAFLFAALAAARPIAGDLPKPSSIESDNQA
jgi:O-antigen ligase